MATLPVLSRDRCRIRRCVGLGVVACALGLPALAAADRHRGSAEARPALATCLATDAAPASERDALLRRAVDVAEHAVAADDQDPVAHFAVFCAVGKRLELGGPSLG